MKNKSLEIKKLENKLDYARMTHIRQPTNQTVANVAECKKEISRQKTIELFQKIARMK